MSAADSAMFDDLVGGYGKMTILNGTTSRSARRHHHRDRPERRRQIDRVQGDLRPLAGARGQRSSSTARDVTNLYAAPAARRRHLLRAAGPQYFSRTVGAPQYRTRRRGLPTRPSCRRGSTAIMSVSGAAARRRTRRPRRLSGGEQKLLEIARGLLLDPKLMLIDEPSIGLSPLMVQETFEILKELRDSGVIDPDDRAERQAGAADFRLRHRARARPDPHRGHAAEDPRRSAHRATVPRRRAWRNRRSRIMTRAQDIGRAVWQKHPRVRCRRRSSPMLSRQLGSTVTIISSTSIGCRGRRLPQLLDAVRAAGFAGVNITYPFKQDIIPLLDAVDPRGGTRSARSIRLLSLRTAT